jgi:hypothetical protein
MIKEFVLQWPVLHQILHGGDGTGPEAMSHRTQTLRPKNEGAKVARSVCPYCAVGCGQLVFHQEGKLVSIEGDPESPISRGAPRPLGEGASHRGTFGGSCSAVGAGVLGRFSYRSLCSSRLLFARIPAKPIRMDLGRPRFGR